MKSLFLAFLSLAVVGATSIASASSHPLLAEFQRLRTVVAATQPEFEVAGYLKGKNFGDYKLLWKLASKEGESEVIRLYRVKGGSEQPLDVTYHKNDQIVPGQTVVRRFVGPAVSGWRNDTVDAATGTYLGRQGAEKPWLDARDLEILQTWGVELYLGLFSLARLQSGPRSPRASSPFTAPASLATNTSIRK